MKWKASPFVLGALAATLFAGSSAIAQQQARLTQRTPAEQPVHFQVFLPLQHEAELDQLLVELHTATSPLYQKWLTPAEFQRRFGPSSQSLQSVRDELTSRGLSVEQVSPSHLQVTGTAAAVEHAFATELHSGTSPGNQPVIGAVQPLVMTPMLQALDAVVAGLSPTLHMHVNSRRAPAPDNRYSPVGPYWFDDLKQAYEWPSAQAYEGYRTTIGILMTGGYNLPDMVRYFKHEKIAVPPLREVKVDGGLPYDPNISFETHLDIQQAGGMAPHAQIVLYNIPNLSDQSIIDGLEKILEDNQVDVVNMSFSGPELGYTALYNGGTSYVSILRFENQLFKRGNAQGITFVSGSGDLGALSVPAPACFAPNATSSCGGFLLSAEFPASSPHVTGVGGTNLITTKTPGSLNSAYLREFAYGDPLDQDIFYGTPAKGGFWGSGGGDSIVFPKPPFQYLVDTHSNVRSVPDLALHMGGCPFGATQPCGPDRSSDIVAIAGAYYAVVGTSASSPDIAGLIALTVQRSGKRLGNANYYIYQRAAEQDSSGIDFFHRGIQGFNGFYHAGPGYNRVLGNGTVEGRDFMLVPNVPAAGVPQTPSNP